jgi:hypothetical protein
MYNKTTKKVDKPVHGEATTTVHRKIIKRLEKEVSGIGDEKRNPDSRIIN